MFLATSTAGGTPPYYLVSGDNAVYLHDTLSVQGFKKVGIPVVTFSSADLSALAASLAPAASNYVDAGAVAFIDGGAPNTVLYIDDFDGGSSTDIIDGAPPVDGNS